MSREIVVTADALILPSLMLPLQLHSIEACVKSDLDNRGMNLDHVLKFPFSLGSTANALFQAYKVPVWPQDTDFSQKLSRYTRTTDIRCSASCQTRS